MPWLKQFVRSAFRQITSTVSRNERPHLDPVLLKFHWVGNLVFNNDVCGHDRHSLFDDLIGADEQARRDFEAERPGGSQIDHQVELARLHDRQIANLFAFKNPTDINPRLSIAVVDIRSIAHQASDIDELAQKIDA